MDTFVDFPTQFDIDDFLEIARARQLAAALEWINTAFIDFEDRMDRAVAERRSLEVSND